MKFPRLPIVIALASAIALGGTACAQSTTAEESKYAPTVGQFGKDVVWVPTPQALVDRMLDMAALKPGDRLVDLGSGDGRTVITAARRGVPARGIEFNPDMVVLARRAAAAEGVADRARFEQGDIFESDFSEATVVTLFLLPALNVRLRPILLDMPAGTRILSNSFTMGDWQPDETAFVPEGCASWCSAYKWVVPAKVAGTWKIDDGELVLTQKYQVLEGALRTGGATAAITEARLDGERIQFSAGEQRYVGQVTSNAMQGTINGTRTWTATR